VLATADVASPNKFQPNAPSIIIYNGHNLSEKGESIDTYMNMK